MTPASSPLARIDRAAVMIEARRQYAIMGPLGWTFARCLAYSWNKIKRAGGANATSPLTTPPTASRGALSEGGGAARAGFQR